MEGSLHSREQYLAKSSSVVPGMWCAQCPKDGITRQVGILVF